MFPRRWCGTLWLALAVALTGACQTVIVPEGKLVDDTPNPECPHDYRGERSPIGALIDFTKSGVPEFNDCQRLIRRTPAGLRTYGPLAAIFAKDSIDTLGVSNFAAPVVVALIYKPEELGYDELHLRGTNSCLVLRRMAGTLRAWVLGVDAAAQCQSAVPLTALRPSDELQVREIPPPPGLQPKDIPPVARWDWDEQSGTQFIGVRCGPNWCEVGRREGFETSAQYDDPAATSPESRRNIAIKGWYDEQPLAHYLAPAPSEPMKGLGTVIPSEGLASMTATSVAGEWVEVASIFMRPDAGAYAKDFNFIGTTVAPPGGEHSRLWLCMGDAARCKPIDGKSVFDPTACDADSHGRRWYARVDHPSQPPRYFCVVYREHPAGFVLPAMVRWRWRANDETIWVSCPAGCCEVNAKKK